VLALDVLAVDALAANALADALADALAVGEAVDWERLVCPTVVLCEVVACGDVVSPVVVVPVCAPVVPVVVVVVPVVVPVVPVVVPVVPVVVPVVAVIVPVVVVVEPVVVVVVGVVDSGGEVVAARSSSRFATVGPTSPLIPRLMVAFEELSIASVSTLAHSCSLNTLTIARPSPSGSPPPATFSSCPPPR